MTSLHPGAARPPAPRAARQSLSPMAACLPMPRAGAGRVPPGPRGVVALPQRAPREVALPLTVSGLPGLSLDLEHNRAILSRDEIAHGLDRLAMAYLRADRNAGMPLAEQAQALAELLRQPDLTRGRALKVELVGPVSLALQLVDDQERPLAYDPALCESLVQHVTLRAIWVAEEIVAAGCTPLICLDEPFLDALGSPFCPLDWEEGGDLLARTLAALPGPRGLCVSGAPPWDSLLALPVELICFDAYAEAPALIRAAPYVAAFLERGGILGWGVVPTDPGALGQEQAATLAQRFTSSVEYLAAAAGLAAERICAATIITTDGPLQGLPPNLARQAALLCGEVAAQVRTRHHLER